MRDSKIYQPHYSTATNSRVVQTRRSIRAAFLSLLGEKPLSEITAAEIANVAGIGYTTFYRHYPDKEALLNEIAREEIRNVIDAAFPSFERDDTRSSALILCSHVYAHKDLWRALLSGGASDQLRDEFIRITKEISLFRSATLKWLPPEAARVFAVSSSIELFKWWLSQAEPISVKEFALVYERTVIWTVSKELVPVES